MPSTDTAAIRAWAQANGHPVGDRGRLPSEVVSAYRSARKSVAAKAADKPAAKKRTKAGPTARTTAPKKVAKAPVKAASPAKAATPTKVASPAKAATPTKTASAEPVKIVTDDLPLAATVPPTPPAATPPTATPPAPAPSPSVAKVAPPTVAVESRLAAMEVKLTEALRRLEALETAPKRKFGRRS